MIQAHLCWNRKGGCWLAERSWRHAVTSELWEISKMLRFLNHVFAIVNFLLSFFLLFIPPFFAIVLTLTATFISSFGHSIVLKRVGTCSYFIRVTCKWSWALTGKCSNHAVDTRLAFEMHVQIAREWTWRSANSLILRWNEEEGGGEEREKGISKIIHCLIACGVISLYLAVE